MKLLVITGHQRSGTSVYRNALAALGSVFDFGEVFTEERSDNVDPGSFYHFAKYKNYTDGVADYKTVEKRWTQLEEYRDYLTGLYPDCSVGMIDAKLSFLHNFNATSQLPTSCPLFIQFCIENNIPIIHFHRRDIVAQYVSLKIAEQIQKWHYVKEAKLSLEIEPFEVDLNSAVSDMASMSMSSRLMSSWIKNYSSGYTFIYEEMYDKNHLKEEYDNITKKIFLLNQDEEIVLPFQRTPVVPDEVIKNLAELRNIAGSAYQYY